MWQGDTFQFRIPGIGKVYVSGFSDDCSRNRVKSKAYVHNDPTTAVNALCWALRAGRIIREFCLDNGIQFISKIFNAEAHKHDVN